MKYFTINELTRSATAKRLGIDNTPNKSIRANLEALGENVLDPLREAWGAPIIVTSGYRCQRLNKAVGGASNSQHCFDEKTEILTESGWKTYKSINEDDNVLSYNLEKDTVELTPIDSIIIREQKGKMMHMHTTCIDVMVTDKHRMLVRYAPHKYVRKGGRNISESGQAYFDTLKTDNDKYHFELADEVFGKRRLFKCASIYDGACSVNVDLLKFCIAFVCDGYWCVKEDKLSIGFRFKKERKIIYLQRLATKLGWTYSINKDKNGVTNFYFRTEYGEIVSSIIGRDKVLPKYLIHLSEQEKVELLRCYTAFDGNVDTRDDKERFSICTTIKENADILQAMAITCDIKCSIITKESTTYEINGTRGIAKEAYILQTCRKNETKCSKGGYEWVDYDGIVWCVNNRNTTLITRRNGKVSIQGNCYGQAADIRTVSDRREDNMKLLRKIIEMELPFDKLIAEYVDSSGRPDWIHISYSPARRGIKLTCKGGKYSLGIKIDKK